MSGSPPKESPSKPVLPGTTAAALAGVNVTLWAPAGAAERVVRVTRLAGAGPVLLASSRISGRRPCLCSAVRRVRMSDSLMNCVGSS